MGETKQTIAIIKEFCEDNGYEFRDDYSGRGMYGKICVGIVGDFNPLWLVLCLADVIRDSVTDDDICAEDFLGEPRQDSMGKQIIVYFPKLEVK